MAINRTKVQNRAEKLVGQGKISQAIDQYKILLKDQPNDLATLNRVGDLMARTGKMSEATHLFGRAAHLYTTGGFFLKAIAIYKKILKLDPGTVDARLRLADLYARGDFTSEARVEYVTVVERLVQQGFDAKAREVHEKLVRMEPANVRARALLAEVYLARGDLARGVGELLSAAGELEKLGIAAGSLELHRQILGLDPPDPETVLGSIRATLRLGAFDLAVPAAEVLYRKEPGRAPRAEAFIEALELSGRSGEAEEIAATALAGSAEAAVPRMVLGRLRAGAGDLEGAVQLLLGAARDLVRENRHAEAARALDTLLEREPEHLHALEQRMEVARMLGRDEELAALSARRAVVSGRIVEPESESDAAPAPEQAAAPAPPVLTREETEFLNEHLTEAEVFTKYGLFHKAVGPLLEVVERFPDHLDSRQRLKSIYVEQGKCPQAVEQCLAISDLQRRAGRREEAISAVIEARILDPDNPAVESALDALGVRQVSARGGAAKTGSGREAAPSPEDGRSRGPARASGAARQKAEGAGDAGTAAAEETRPEAADAARSGQGTDRGAEVGADFFNLEGEFGDSLAEVLASEPAIPAPQQEEESFEEVFKAFQKKVDEVVDSEDFKTHYELAIAYKEMGLMDEAIAEFEYTSKDPQRLVDCCTLIGMCLRERGTPEQAESWYLKALEAPTTSPAQTLGLRYELAETYLEMGKRAKAEELFRKVADVDRNYRNVALRLEEAGSVTP